MSLNNTIAQLYLEKGRALASGEQGAGQAWGSALANIGQTVGNVVQQIPAMQAASQTRDLITKTPKVDLGGGVMGYDVPTIADAVVKAGGDPSTAAQHLMAINNGFQQVHAARLDAIKNGALAVMAAGNDPTLANDYLDSVEKNGLYAPKQVQEFRDLIKQDPANVAKITSYLAGPQKLEKVGPNESLVNPNNPTKAVFTAPPKPGEGQHEINGQLVGPDGQPIGAPIPKQATPLAPEEIALKKAQIDEITAKLSGTVPMSQKDKAELQIQRDKLAQELKLQNPFGVGTGTPQGAALATQVNGEEFLKTLPPGLAMQVKSYAEGRQQFPSGFALKSPYFQQMLQAVGQYDPTFDATQFNARSKARADLTSPNGTGGKTINALNTAIQHAGKLSDLIEALGNNDIPAANFVANTFSKAMGRTGVTNFEAVQPQLMKEIERAWRGAGGASGDIQQLKDSLGKNAGIQQQREALDQFLGLMEGKLKTTETQRDNALGPVAGAQIPVLFKDSQPVIEKIRSRAAGEQAPASAPAGRIRVKGPNGESGTVPEGTELPAGWSKVGG